MLSPNPTSLRTFIADNEMEVLALVGLYGRKGYIIEQDQETKEIEFLVTDGYLSRTVQQGVSRTYCRYRLTDAGLKALAMRRTA